MWIAWTVDLVSIVCRYANWLLTGIVVLVTVSLNRLMGSLQVKKEAVALPWQLQLPHSRPGKVLVW
jgi:hypothetical protein